MRTATTIEMHIHFNDCTFTGTFTVFIDLSVYKHKLAWISICLFYKRLYIKLHINALWEEVVHTTVHHNLRQDSVKGGVHIYKLAYGDLIWEKLSLPKPFPLWYTMRIGLNQLGPGSIPMGNIWIGPWANFPHYMDRTLTAVDWSVKTQVF